MKSFVPGQRYLTIVTVNHYQPFVMQNGADEWVLNPEAPADFGKKASVARRPGLFQRTCV